MNKNLRQAVFLIFLISILTLPYFVFADSAALDKLKKLNTGGQAGFDPAANEFTAIEALGILVKSFLSILGIIFIILIIYGGYNWMTAGGNETKVEKAGNIIKRAIIGLIIIAGSTAIWWFVFSNVITTR